jgi:VanZ family protein
MLTHAVGMLGQYDDIRWWDHLTHIHSSTLLGGLIHVLSRRLGVDPRLRVITGVATMGIIWELMEYIIHASSRRVGLEPILVSYSKVDTLLDLVFNLIGAALVLVFGDTLLRNLIRHENE